jgi:Cu2+-exporting ATPase
MDCTLCDLPVESNAVTDESVDGTFCCRGCLEVYRQLGDVDPDQAEPTQHDDETYPDTAESTYFSVDGMHCSTCEVYLEMAADEADGVYDADASYAAETVKVVYDSDQTDSEEIGDAISGFGYVAASRGDDTEVGSDLQSRLLVGGIFGMMAMTWYGIFLYPTYFGFDPIVTLGTFDGAYLYGQLAVVTAVILLYTGGPMLRGAYVSLRTRRPNVDLLVTVAALAAYLYSTARLLTGGSDLYYDVTIVVVLAVTIGNYYEDRIKRRATGLLADLTELQVDTARLENGETVSVETLDPGDRLLIKPGERVPIDGTVREGRAAVDEALVTGESLPETKTAGDAVEGGTVVTDRPLVVEVGADADSTLDRIVEMLWEIQATRPGAQRVADRLATVFVPLVLSLAGLITVALLVTGSSLQVSVLTGLTVLIVSCPCALGLATPLAVAAGLQSAANRGVVVATPALFESASDVDTVVFDKTGTVTDGRMSVTAVHAPATNTDQVLERAARVERFSDHPIAASITAASSVEHAQTSDEIADFESFHDGVAGPVDGDRVLVGHPDRFSETGWNVPDELSDPIAEARERGSVPVVVGWNGAATGVVVVGDSPRPEWDAVASELGEQMRIVVLTGDDSVAAGWLRDHPSVDEVFAGVPPDGKAETVRRLAATETVAMAGDGSNDAPALAAADLGIALGDGAKLASDAGDAIIVDGDLRRVPDVFDIATQTRRRIRQNLAWAFLYNGIAIPLALTGVLNPLFAALAMATSSLFVVANSARTTENRASEGTTADQPSQDPATNAAPT